MTYLKNLLKDNYVDNDETSYDIYLGDMYINTHWREELEDEFHDELKRIQNDRKEVTDYRVRRAARRALRQINKEFKYEMEKNKENDSDNNSDSIHLESSSASNNEIITIQLCENVQSNLFKLNADLLKKIGKLLGIVVSKKTKEQLCESIATKLTKPVKITKQLQRSKWEPVSIENHKQYKHLINSISRTYTNGKKMPSLEYAVTKTCRNMEDTLYYDLPLNILVNIAKQMDYLKDDDNYEMYDESEIDSIKQELCQHITENMCYI